MNGNDPARYRLVKIFFPRFYFNDAFTITASLSDKEIAWDMGCDFKINHINKSQDALTIIITLTLRKKGDENKIAELVTESTYHVELPISFGMKIFLFNIVVNQTLAHAQGAWRVKNKNLNIALRIPQGFDKAIESGINWDKYIYERWD